MTAIAHIFASRHDFDIDVNLEPVLEGSLDTPLHLAARMNNRDIIETLLKHGGQALRNSESLTPVQVAGMLCWPGIYRLGVRYMLLIFLEQFLTKNLLFQLFDATCSDVQRLESDPRPPQCSS